MSRVSLDQILRSLPEHGEVRFDLADFPLDEVLLTLHETRFTGEVRVGSRNDEDRLVWRNGHVIDAFPPDPVHMRLLSTVIMRLELMSGDVLREQIEADARLSAPDVAECFVLRGLIAEPEMRKVACEIARLRLYELYERIGDPINIRQGLDDAVTGAFRLSPLPAASYGVVVRAAPARRAAMLAFAANKRLWLLRGYDVQRNRCGLPEPMLREVEQLAEQGAQFSSSPALGKLTSQQTAGLLLLLQRMGLLQFGEPTRPPSAPEHQALTREAFDEQTDRFDRKFS